MSIPDRVAVRGSRGTPPPDALKVALNYAGGYRNTMTLMITGLDAAAKAAVAEQAIWARIRGGKSSFDTVAVELAGSDPALTSVSCGSPSRTRTGPRPAGHSPQR